jgi:uncharacterized protein
MNRPVTNCLLLTALLLCLCGCSRTAMLAAAEKGDVKKVKQLLAKDPKLADACEFLAQGRSAIHLATQNGHAVVVAALLEAGARTNYSHLMELAASQGHTPVMEVLFEKGFPVQGDMLGSPLLSAAASGQLAAAEFLLAHGTDVNEQDQRRDDGCAALHYAAVQGQSAMVTTLLAHGANIEIQNNGGSTPLFYAAAGGNPEAVEVLLQNGAKVNACGRQGWTPLMRAVANAHPNVLPALIAHGADVNARNEDQDTALTIAVKEIHNPANPDDSAMNKANEKKSLHLVNFLLEHKADVTARNKDNETALTLAEKQNWQIVAAVLRAPGGVTNKTVSP